MYNEGWLERDSSDRSSRKGLWAEYIDSRQPVRA